MRLSYLDAGQSSPFDVDFDTSSLFESPLLTNRLATNTPRVFIVPFRPKTAALILRPIPKVVPHKSRRSLPYFGHQQLDLDYFPEHIGAPVCDCPLGGPIDGWDEDGDSEGVADIESEAEDEADFEGVKATAKAPRKPKTTARKPDGQIAKKMKVAGGRPAVAKKVTADLDSDDELIVRMKEARYLEKDIAQALIDQGRTAYNPKTIGTRWRRLKAALQKRQDALLDADLTDWHDGDDDVLVRAIAKSEKEIRRLREDIESRKWRMVADAMKNEKPVLNFSQNACRKRFEELLDGTAKPTPESIVNPTAEVLERIESRKAKQRNLDEQSPQANIEQRNVEANGWTSRQRIYF
ncbi:uncharacterized protein A1O9_02451 [Exophiala aquamarina CBS 119918]|uniref:DUF7626 domain-containing protein n=1 Tax=Exophiala aquamarina CBS 119918 TaxID=1182545 RepID=A0A072PMC0_9EURO|nr:uncharacterized protein A1O9_02451 [Exophiala aquamarina CBS 119918]KEF60887.1 hypothetical protein A1O9_02451 [Exophiala aquamarina CBS 119918]